MRGITYILLMVSVFASANDGIKNTFGEVIFYSDEIRRPFATFNVTNNSEWSSAYASAVAGDVINVRAGTYSAMTIGKAITVIGYDNTPGDIVASNGSTFSQGDSPNAGLMPLIFSSGATGTGLTISASNAVVKNFQIQGFSVGCVTNSVTNVELDNIVAIDQGNQNATNYDGFGIRVNNSTFVSVTNSYVENSTAEGFKIYGGNNNYTNYVHSFCDNTTNGMDYYFLLSTTNNNLLENSTVYRTVGLQHNGHGLTLKWDCQDNIFRGGTITGTSLEMNFEDVTGNLYEDIRIIGNGDYGTRIYFGSGANNNTVRNVYMTNVETAIIFIDQDDGFQPNPDTDAANLGYSNRLENLIIENAIKIFDALPHLPVGGDVNAWMQDNIWDGCTFINITRYGSYYARNSGNQFINCLFKDVDNPINVAGSPYVTNGDNTIWTNNRFENSPVPSGTNITSGTIGFTNTGTGVERFQLTSGSAARNAGADTSNPDDYWGATRDTSPDLGAIQFGSTPGGSGNAAPVVTLTGSSTINLNVGATYTEQGASWTDAEDGSGTISSPTSGSVNTSVANTYTLTYTYTDAGGLSDSVTRTVIVSENAASSTGILTSRRRSF